MILEEIRTALAEMDSLLHETKGLEDALAMLKSDNSRLEVKNPTKQVSIDSETAIESLKQGLVDDISAKKFQIKLIKDKLEKLK